MNETFQSLTEFKQNPDHKKNAFNDTLLGEILSNTKYEDAAIVIIGCPQDEGIKRIGGREGSALAPQAIREQLYQLTPFGLNTKVCDLGDLELQDSLENTHEKLSEILKKVLVDGKKAIVIGGSGDIAYAIAKAMSETFEANRWIGVNVSARLNASQADEINSQTSYRQILKENLIRPDYLYEIGYQSHFTSPAVYRELQKLRVNFSSLEQIRSRETADLELREMMRQQFVNHSSTINSFFDFNISAIRSTDAPGNSMPSPLGLRAGEFITLVKYAAGLTNTKIIDFADMNPNFDIDNRTAQLIAIAIHRFCSLQPK